MWPSELLCVCRLFYFQNFEQKAIHDTHAPLTVYFTLGVTKSAPSSGESFQGHSLNFRTAIRPISNFIKFKTRYRTKDFGNQSSGSLLEAKTRIPAKNHHPSLGHKSTITPLFQPITVNVQKNCHTYVIYLYFILRSSFLSSGFRSLLQYFSKVLKFFAYILHD